MMKGKELIMTLNDFIEIQELDAEQAKILEDVASKLTEKKVILNPEHLYKALASDNAVLAVSDAAKLLDVTPHYIRILGKKGKLKIDGRKKIHRVEYKSLLNYIKGQNNDTGN